MPELSYVHGASDVPLLGEPIFQNLRRTAARFGDREALVAAHQSYRSTYNQLVAQCEVVARGLMARGVKPGDRVGIWSPNRFEWVVVQYATAAMGAILVNINPAYRTSELEYALNQSGISFFILASSLGFCRRQVSSISLATFSANSLNSESSLWFFCSLPRSGSISVRRRLRSRSFSNSNRRGCAR